MDEFIIDVPCSHGVMPRTVCGDATCTQQYINWLSDRAEQAEQRVAGLEALATFWKRLWPDMGQLGSDDVIDTAVATGLIKIEPHAQPCENEACPCDGEFTEMYVETSLLKVALASATPEGPRRE